MRDGTKKALLAAAFRPDPSFDRAPLNMLSMMQCAAGSGEKDGGRPEDLHAYAELRLRKGQSPPDVSSRVLDQACLFPLISP
jgi:hypothetical protein